MTTPARPLPTDILWLSAALVVMPFLQWLPIDFDRSVALFLFAPFLWSGRSLLGAAFGRLSQASRWFQASAAALVVTLIASVLLAGQFAPAATTAASWLVLLGVGLTAGERVTREPAAGPRLLGALVLGTTAGTLAVWLLWWWNGRGAVPLYAHHRIFGLHMIGGAVAAVAVLVDSWKRPGLQRLAWGSAGLVNWGGLLWSGSRGPLLAVFLGLATWWLVSGTSMRRRLLPAGAVLLVGGMLLSLALWSPRRELGWWNAFLRTATPVEGAPALSLSAVTSTRSDFWRESLQRVQLRPWLGHGPDAYRYLTPKLDGQQPHNFIIQLLLDVGLLGTLAALLGLTHITLAGLRRARAEQGEGGAAPWLALAVASLTAGLLDGVFYHVLAFLPAMLALGMLAATVPNSGMQSVRRGWTIAGHGLLLVSVAVLMLHAWVFYSLAVAPAPDSPRRWPARLVRAFPSTTFGLWHWLDAWDDQDPAAALDWSRWAQQHSANPLRFHFYAAQRLLSRGDHAGARQELEAARAKAHRLNQPAIAEMLRALDTSR